MRTFDVAAFGGMVPCVKRHINNHMTGEKLLYNIF
jgi:hypothetical protein